MCRTTGRKKRGSCETISLNKINQVTPKQKKKRGQLSREKMGFRPLKRMLPCKNGAEKNLQYRVFEVSVFCGNNRYSR